MEDALPALEVKKPKRKRIDPLDEKIAWVVGELQRRNAMTIHEYIAEQREALGISLFQFPFLESLDDSGYWLGQPDPVPGTVLLVAVIHSYHTKQTKAGKTFAILKVGDMTEITLRVVCWPEVWAAYQSVCKKGSIVAIQGTLGEWNDEPSVVADFIIQWEGEDGKDSSDQGTATGDHAGAP